MEEEDRGGRTENIKVICQPQRALKGGGGGGVNTRGDGRKKGEDSRRRNRRGSQVAIR